MHKVFKYLAILNCCLIVAGCGGSAWVARSTGSSAYTAGALATLIVSLAASSALLITYRQSRSADSEKEGGVSAILLAMLVRMGLPIAAVIVMPELSQSTMEAGFFGLLTLNYLVALPLETYLSLQFINKSNTTVAI